MGPRWLLYWDLWMGPALETGPYWMEGPGGLATAAFVCDRGVPTLRLRTSKV